MSIAGNTSQIKSLNLELIRSAVKDHPNSSKAAITAWTGLSQATCNSLLNQLVEAGEVLEVGKVNNTGGRPTQTYEYNPDYYHILCLYLEGPVDQPVLAYGVYNLLGKVIAGDSLTTPQMDYAFLAKSIAEVVAKYPAIQVISLGVPGVVIDHTSIGLCDFKAFENMNVVERLRQEFSQNIIVENDLNAVALGYHSRRTHKDNSSLAVLLFTSNQFPGAGIIVHNQLLRGHKHFAGEVSFLPVGFERNIQDDFAMDIQEAYPLILKSVAAMIAILDPAEIILAGNLIDQAVRQQVAEDIGTMIPLSHVPHIGFLSSIKESYLTGLYEQAKNFMAYPVQITKLKL